MEALLHSYLNKHVFMALFEHGCLALPLVYIMEMDLEQGFE